MPLQPGPRERLQINPSLTNSHNRSRAMRRPLDFGVTGRKKKNVLYAGVGVSYRLVPYMRHCQREPPAEQVGHVSSIRAPMVQEKSEHKRSSTRLPRRSIDAVQHRSRSLDIRVGVSQMEHRPTVCRTKEHVFSGKILSTEFGLGARKAVRNGAELIKARNCGTTWASIGIMARPG